MTTSFFMAGDGAFPETHWSIIHRAKGEGTEAEQAMADICTQYWFPIYVYLRKRTSDRNEAEDLTQGFFYHLLEDKLVLSATQNHGRFRSYLMRCCQNFCIDEHRYETAQKRGGGRKILSIDSQEAEIRYHRLSGSNLDSDREFTRTWAITILERAFDHLRDEYAGANRLELYEALRPTLIHDPVAMTYREIGAQVRMSEEAVKKAAATLRRRFAREIRKAVAKTVSHQSDVDHEIRELFLAFQS